MLDLRRHGALYKQLARAGVFLGAGGFQLFDGTEHRWNVCAVSYSAVRFEFNQSLAPSPHSPPFSISGLFVFLVHHRS